jgi:hypothetical protein
MRSPSLTHHGSPAFKSRPHLDPRRFPRSSPIQELQTPERASTAHYQKKYKKYHKSMGNLINHFRVDQMPVYSPMRDTPSPLLLRNLSQFIPGRDGFSFHLLKESGMVPPVFENEVSPSIQDSVILSLQYAQEWVQSPFLFSIIMQFLTMEDLGHLDFATINTTKLRKTLYHGWEHHKSTLSVSTRGNSSLYISLHYLLTIFFSR